MKCVILAAGYATRLYPLTENFPKPLLKVGEKTILDWLLEDIHTSSSVDEYIVISNHKFRHGPIPIRCPLQWWMMVPIPMKLASARCAIFSSPSINLSWMMIY